MANVHSLRVEVTLMCYAAPLTEAIHVRIGVNERGDDLFNDVYRAYRHVIVPLPSIL